MYKVN